MNIVMFGKGNPDYLHDMLYHGFRQLGHTVLDLPRKPNLHAPRGEEGLLKLHWDEQEIKGPTGLMLVCAMPADFGPDASAYKSRLLDALVRYNPSKIALVDGSDLAVPHPDYAGPFDAVFKRELLIGDPQPANWHNLPFAAFPEVLVLPYKGYKNIDVLYMGSVSCQPFRVRVLQELTDFASRNSLVTACSLDPVSRDTYLELVRRSKVVVSVRGYGWDCYRYWETPALGAVMVTEDIPIHFENDFVDGVDCFKFATGDTMDMQRKLVQALSLSDADREKIGINAWYRTKKMHTPLNRAKFVIEKVFGGN